MTRFLLVCLCLAWTGVANAQAQRTNLGTLTCTLAEAAEKQEKQMSPSGEERAMRCAFAPTNSGVEQTLSLIHI